MSSSTIQVPSLSQKGWTTSLAEKADLLMAHSFAANANQSLVYNGAVTSIQYIIAVAGDNPSKLCQQLQQAYETYLLRYFDMATVEVSNDSMITTGTTYSITLQITVIDNGVSYSIGSLLSISDSKLAKIVNMNNTGSS